MPAPGSTPGSPATRRAPADRRRLRIGLLGGSFNPAHAGHAMVARAALRALRLDQVWLLVSPGNPLKPRAGMAPFDERLRSARRIADGRRVIATDIEARLGHRRTERTLLSLRRRFPRARFVLVIGADNLWQLPRWGAWKRLAAGTPIAVLPRPGWTRRALRGAAASVLRRRRRRPGALLAGPTPPRAPWALVPWREDPISATALRAGGATAPRPASTTVPRAGGTDIGRSRGPNPSLAGGVGAAAPSARPDEATDRARAVTTPSATPPVQPAPR